MAWPAPDPGFQPAGGEAMREIALHLLDLIQNALTAGASSVLVRIEEDPPPADRLAFTIQDNGPGLSPETLARATQPRFTTKPGQGAGLGLSWMQANARAWGGDLSLASQPGQGATLRVWFRRGHPDRPPLGDWPATLAGLILSHPGVDFLYQHRVGPDEFELSTRELRAELGDAALADAELAMFLRDQVRQALSALGADQDAPRRLPPARA